MFYSPGENFDSPPAHTKFSGGKIGFRIVFGKMSPDRPHPTRKPAIWAEKWVAECPDRGTKMEHYDSQLGGSLQVRLAVPGQFDHELIGFNILNKK